MTDVQGSIATRSPDQELRTDGAGPGGTEGSHRGSDRTSETSGEQSPAESPDSGETGSEGRTIRLPDVPYLRLTGFAVIGVGVLIVLFLVYLLAFTPLTASRNQQRLTQSMVGQPLAVFRLVDGKVPPEGSAVAVLEIPALGVRQVVVEGTSAADLMNGPGLMPGSALPGTVGNAVIAARRVTFGAPFGSLARLRPGDRIRAVDGAGSFAYRVTRIRTVSAGQPDVVGPTADNRITLVTSNSSVVTSGRLVVQGKLVGKAYSLTSDAVAVPSYELGLSGDPVAGGLAVLWSVLTLIVLVGAAFAVWRWRRPWLVYLFAAPVIMMCGLLACESVARALPATF